MANVWPARRFDLAEIFGASLKTGAKPGLNRSAELCRTGEGHEVLVRFERDDGAAPIAEHPFLALVGFFV